MSVFLKTLLYTLLFIACIPVIDYYSYAKDYRRKIQRIAMNHFDELISVLGSEPDRWGYYLTSDEHEKGDMLIDLGIDLSSKKRQFLIINFRQKCPDGRGLRKEARFLYQEMKVYG